MYEKAAELLKEGMVIIADAIHNLASAIREANPKYVDIDIARIVKKAHEKEAGKINEQAEAVKKSKPRGPRKKKGDGQDSG